MNRKIRLELESLDVESFETSVELKERGTVRGNACSDSTCLTAASSFTGSIKPGRSKIFFNVVIESPANFLARI